MGLGLGNNCHLGLINRVVYRPPALQLKSHVALTDSVRAFEASRPRGYAQRNVLTLERIIAHPRVLCQDQQLEVSGADFLSGLSVWAHMIHVSCLNVFGLCFLMSVAQRPPVCGRFAGSACVCQTEQNRCCLTPVEA